ALPPQGHAQIEMKLSLESGIGGLPEPIAQHRFRPARLARVNQNGGKRQTYMRIAGHHPQEIAKATLCLFQIAGPVQQTGGIKSWLREIRLEHDRGAESLQGFRMT